MNRRYLPSAQFSLIAVSLVLSGGLVYAASFFTKSGLQAQVTSAPVATTTESTAVQNWEAILYAIQAGEETASTSSTDTAAQNSIAQNNTAAAAQDSLTNDVGLTLLNDISGSAGQNGSIDQGSEEQAVTDALGQLDKTPPTKAYGMSDLTVVADSTTTLHAYGNALALVVLKDNNNNVRNTMIAVDNATSQDDPHQLAALPSIQAQYVAFVNDLLQVPVPQTLAPFHLAIINDLSQVANTYPDMQTLLSDPLRGLTALQQYQTISNETVSVFINIAQQLNKDGILFNKGEPGAVWSALLTAQ